jgi:hypothetical protein
MNTDELHPLQRRIAQGIAGATDSRLSAEDILSLGYRFWTEPGSGCLWIRNRHGVEITMHQLIQQQLRSLRNENSSATIPHRQHRQLRTNS